MSNHIDWQRQHLLLSGASGGLGQALATALSERGARLTLIGRQSDKLAALAQRLQQQYLVLDINAPTAALQLMDYIEQQTTAVTGLINNAALASDQLFIDSDIDAIEQLLQTNLLTPIRLTHALLPWLQQQPQALLLNIGSVFGALGYPGQVSYCASKFGLRGFSQALRRELQDTTIQVFYCAPRAIATAFNSDTVQQVNEQTGSRADAPEQVAKRIVRQLDGGRYEQVFGWPERFYVWLNQLQSAWVDGSMRKPLAIYQRLQQEKRL